VAMTIKQIRSPADGRNCDCLVKIGDSGGCFRWKVTSRVSRIERERAWRKRDWSWSRMLVVGLVGVRMRLIGPGLVVPGLVGVPIRLVGLGLVVPGSVALVVEKVRLNLVG